jgi:energy-coupling factor transporter transmembrane protein EcfT
VHPSARLVVWLLMLLLSQGMDDRLLMPAILLLPLFGRSVLSRCLQLAWRARWLFVSLSVILAWGGVGDPAWSGPLAPSREGLLEALTQAGRLLAVLMVVAVLREQMPASELLIGIHRLLEPLRRCGVDVDRGVVRLLLVLNHLETMPRPRDWRLLLAAPTARGGEIFELPDRQLGGHDYLVIALIAVGGGSLLLFWQP